MARAKQSKASFIARERYTAQYRKDHPLLQARVPRKLYEQCRKRARAVDFSISKWMKRWLEFTLSKHPGARV